jgi:catechol 2,3-dioxygenase-like lactoylglutathione lyase family enzyme
MVAALAIIVRRRDEDMEARISIITLGVKDMARAIRFYRDGLGLPTEAKDDAQIAFFATAGARLALYPLDALAADIGPELRQAVAGFGGITIAHNVRRKEEVAETLELARAAGARIVKEAQDVFWGGHSGYFTDPDGYYWEVAWSPRGEFDETGSVIL